jgi:hypothetical protein
MVELDIGFVGEVTKVDPTILNVLCNDGYIPVVATIATDATGQALNINADTAAGEVRLRLCAVPRELAFRRWAAAPTRSAMWVSVTSQLPASP